MQSGSKRPRKEDAAPRGAQPGGSEPVWEYLPRPALAGSCDVTLVCADGTELPAHSHVLSLASPVLATAFEVERDKRLTIPFHECGPKVVALFLRGVYGPYDQACDEEAYVRGRRQLWPFVNCETAVLEDVLRLAHKLDVTIVRNLAVDAFEHNGCVTMEDIARLITLADFVQSRRLERIAEKEARCRLDLCGFIAEDLTALLEASNKEVVNRVVAAISDAARGKIALDF